MKRILLLLFIALAAPGVSLGQSSPSETDAAKSIQPTQLLSVSELTPAQPAGGTIKIPAGTAIEVEVAYTVDSMHVKPGEHISFRVLVPIIIDGATVIEKDALVTARIIEAKRGGHWGKAGKLVWAMEDVVAADNSRIPLFPETRMRTDKIWSLENKPKTPETKAGTSRVRGDSHAAEVATMSIATGVLFPPLALLGGFKRGGNAILREGRRYVVSVGKESSVKVVSVAAPTE